MNAPPQPTKAEIRQALINMQRPPINKAQQLYNALQHVKHSIKKPPHSAK